jgi:hypothetical protein
LSNTHLIIGDSHAHPDHSNERFTWLGRFIHDVRPDVVVNIGDLADMASLCSGSRAAELEGARYEADINASKDAQDRLFHELRKHKKKLPRMVWTLGNHDIRPERFVQDNPRFAGKIKNEDIGFNDYPWHDVVPFLDTIEIDGIGYSHYFTSGIMGRPIGGVHPAWSIIKKRNQSSTCGHSHVMDFKVDKTPGRSLMGLCVGEYIDYHAGYAGPANDMWSAGIAICRNVEDGLYDFEWVSLNRIKAEYADE